MRSLSSISVILCGLDKILDLLKLMAAILHCVNEADVYHSHHLQHSLPKIFFWRFKDR